MPSFAFALTSNPTRWLAAGGLSVLLLGAAAAAQAQSLKPGLWEHSFTMKSSSGEMEKSMARMQTELAKMPPDQRKMMEQMMAKQGVGLSASANTVKLCISPEQAKNFELPAGDGKCQQTVTQRSSSSIKSSFVCSGPPPSKGEGEMTLKSDTAYTGRSVVDTVVNGKPERMNMDVSGKWLSADCGTIKPIKR
jgi:Protein of unknown function (DUF3617)